MTEIDDALKNIREAREGLEPLRSYGADVTNSIDDLNAIEELLKNPTSTNLEAALKRFEVLMGRAGPYESFIPEIIEKGRVAIEKITKAKEKL
jgi:hypothetical protein